MRHVTTRYLGFDGWRERLLAAATASACPCWHRWQWGPSRKSPASAVSLSVVTGASLLVGMSVFCVQWLAATDPGHGWIAGVLVPAPMLVGVGLGIALTALQVHLWSVRCSEEG